MDTFFPLTSFQKALTGTSKPQDTKLQAQPLQPPSVPSAMLTALNGKLNVGDAIAYPSRKGSSMWMNTAKVTFVGPNRIRALRDNGSYVWISNVANVVILK